MTENKEHPNAMLLRWIADGEEIECKSSNGVWNSIGPNRLLSCIHQGSTYTDECYRIKPKTIRIGKYDVAEPMKEELADGCDYYFLDATEYSGIFQFTWDGGSADKNILANGLIWLSEDDALLAAKAIKELLTGQV